MVGKFEKHIGKGQSIEINGEEFVLKPLNAEFIGDFFKAIKCFGGSQDPEANISDMLANMDDAGLESIKKIIMATLSLSYPEEDSQEMQQFGLKYMSILLPVIFELNSAKLESMDSSKVAELKKKIDGG